MDQPTFPPRHAGMPRLAAPQPVLLETPARRCPACESERVVNAGHVIGAEGMLKVEHRCEACGIAFWFVRKRIVTLTSTAPWHSALATDRHVYQTTRAVPKATPSR